MLARSGKGGTLPIWGETDFIFPLIMRKEVQAAHSVALVRQQAARTRRSESKSKPAVSDSAMVCDYVLCVADHLSMLLIVEEKRRGQTQIWYKVRGYCNNTA
jgi:hypothetical protein